MQHLLLPMISFIVHVEKLLIHPFRQRKETCGSSDEKIRSFHLVWTHKPQQVDSETKERVNNESHTIEAARVCTSTRPLGQLQRFKHAMMVMHVLSEEFEEQTWE